MIARRPRPPRPGRSLRRRLLTVLASALFAVLLAGMAAVSILVGRAEREGWQGRQREAAGRAAEAIRAFLDARQRVLGTFGLFGGDEVSVPESTALQDLLDRHPEFIEVVYVGRRGELVSHAPRDKVGLANLFTMPQSTWYQVARSGRLYVGDVELSAGLDSYLILALPTAAGETIAVRLRMDVLQEVVARLRFGEEGRSYLVASDGRILAHSNPDVVLAATRVPEAGGARALLQAAPVSAHGEYRDLNGRWVLGAAAAVPGTSWTVITEVPVSEAHAHRRLAIWTLLVGLLVVSSAVGLSVFRLLERQFLRPIRELQAGARRIGEGDLDGRLAMPADSEIGQVAAAFDEMAGLLQRRGQELAEQTAVLTASEKRYRAIVEDQTELICRFGTDGVISFVNEAYCRYFGKAREELVGASFLPMIPAVDLPRLKAHLARLGAEQPVATIEHQVLRPDGEVRWQLWTDRAILDDRGGILEYAGVGRDITDRIRAEEALALAKETAEAASRAKSQFLANMSHEIRTPINGVTGMLQLLQSEPLTDRQRRFVGAALHSADILLSLIGDVLDLSKIEAGRLELDRARFALPVALEESVQLFAERAATKGLALSVSLAPDLPGQVVGDPHRLRQVLLNLLGNALKFTTAGGVSVAAGLAEATGDGYLVQFAVQDTGPGIAPEQREAIFESFVQGDASMSRSHGGSGLGLAIARHLVAQMGGRIWVESEVGRGSTFFFTVRLGRAADAFHAAASKALEGRPLGSAALDPAPLPPAPGAHEAVPRAAPGGARILLVEDNEINRIVATEMLLRLGHACRSVHSGEEALAAVAEEAFDLILMDCQMPGMDGYETTAAVRAAEGRLVSGRRLPIIALTAHTMEGDRDRCLAAGMDDYLPKPLRIASLALMLEKWLVPAKLADAAPPS